MADEHDQHVRLEFIGSVDVDAQRAIKFVQELKEIPTEAWCEVQNVWSKPQRSTEKKCSNSNDGNVMTTVQMVCERRVADFLCQRFNKQVRHVSQGELLLVRCRRVFLRAVPPSATARHQADHTQIPSSSRNGGYDEQPGVWKADEKRPSALSRATVVDLLDCLGDQIVDVLDAFQAHAEQADGTPRLAMVGLVQAIDKLWKSNVSEPPLGYPLKNVDTKQSLVVQRRKKPPTELTALSVDRVALHKVRQLLTQMVAKNAVSLTNIPETNALPFLSYTDFIAFYVAFVNTPV